MRLGQGQVRRINGNQIEYIDDPALGWRVDLSEPDDDPTQKSNLA